MNADDTDGWTTYQVTLAGEVGPILRSAFDGLEFESREAGTTLELADRGERDLVDVVALLTAARLTIQELRVVPASGSPATGDVPSPSREVGLESRGPLR